MLNSEMSVNVHFSKILKHLLHSDIETSPSLRSTSVNYLNIFTEKSGRTSSETSALQTQYIIFIILFSASQTYVMVFLVSDQVLYPTC